MKKTFLSIIFILSITIAHAQTWTPKQNFGGAARRSAMAFSIGNKGYVGMGYNNLFYKDLWEYDQSTNTWTQKADFIGTARFAGVSFVVSGKGYVGTGYDVNNSNNKSDFYVYDPAANLWLQVASIPIGRSYACAFAIHDKGYVGTGVGSSGYLKDFWEYNPTTNAWTAKAQFPGHERYEDVAFTIGSYGYIGVGSYAADLYSDFYQYNPDDDMWLQIADCPALGDDAASGFAIKNKGYVVSGSNQQPNGWFNDFWEWDQQSNTWTELVNFSGAPRAFGSGISISGKGYMGLGEAIGYYNDWWEFCPDSCLATSIKNLFDENVIRVSTFNADEIIFNSSLQQNAIVKVFDVNGNIFLTSILKPGENKLDAPTLVGGIYFYEVKVSRENVWRGKMVILN